MGRVPPNTTTKPSLGSGSDLDGGEGPVHMWPGAQAEGQESGRCQCRPCPHAPCAPCPPHLLHRSCRAPKSSRLCCVLQFSTRKLPAPVSTSLGVAGKVGAREPEEPPQSPGTCSLGASLSWAAAHPLGEEGLGVRSPPSVPSSTSGLPGSASSSVLRSVSRKVAPGSAGGSGVGSQADGVGAGDRHPEWWAHPGTYSKIVNSGCPSGEERPRALAPPLCHPPCRPQCPDLSIPRHPLFPARCPRCPGGTSDLGRLKERLLTWGPPPRPSKKVGPRPERAR